MAGCNPWTPSNSKDLFVPSAGASRSVSQPQKSRQIRPNLLAWPVVPGCDCDDMHGGSMLLAIVHGFWKAQNQRTQLKNDHLHTTDNHNHNRINIFLSNLHDVRSMVRPRTLFWVLVPSRSWKSCTAYLPTLVILSCTKQQSMTWLRLCSKGFREDRHSILMQLRRVRPCLISSSSPWLQAWSEQQWFQWFQHSGYDSQAKACFHVL